MNLIDLIKRKDRAITIVPPGLSFSSGIREDVAMQTIELSPGDCIRIDKADEFEELKSYPLTVGWKWSGTGRPSKNHWLQRNVAAPLLRILVVNEEAGLCETLFSAAAEDDQYWHEISFKWPPRLGVLRHFSLVVSCESAKRANAAGGVVLGVAPSFNSRAFIRELIKGVGVEVGPGLNPQILPSREVQVRYVEAASAEEWVTLYKKTDQPDAQVRNRLWEHYLVSNASSLDGVEDHSLDFIFSNHVFEHLMNPIGVLENWSRKLRSTGLVYNVIPDAHACFDLRQPLSDPEEWWEESRNEKWIPDQAKYEKWCIYTAPYNTPEDLIKRGYSIHVHYYSPRSAARLARLVIDEGLFSGYFIGGVCNHKDFALVLYKEKPEYL